jgi:hypothetical protein
VFLSCTVPDLSAFEDLCASAEDCVDDDSPCILGFCERGVCMERILTGLPCDDGDPCTVDARCDDSGQCVGSAKVCDDGDPCTAGYCDAAGACRFDHIPDCEGIICVDNDDCDDGDSCTENLCVGNRCVVEFNEGAECDDGDRCTVNNVCDEGGECVGTPKDCPDDGPCTVGRCDEEGNCQVDLVPGCRPCVDHNDCDDGDPCTNGVCDDKGACVSDPLPNDCGLQECGASPSGCYECGDCDAGFGCNDEGMCDSLCAYVECPQCQVCRDGVCVPSSEGAACTDDGDVCTVSTCQAGQCVSDPKPNDCGTRECGPSPSGCYSCGTCAPGGDCNANGQCVSTVITVTEAATGFVDCSAGSCVVLLDCAGGECALDNWDGTYDRLDESVAAVVLDSDGFIMICWEAPGRVARWISVSVRAEVRAPRTTMIGQPCGTYRIQAQASEAGSPQTLVDASPPSTSWREVGPFSYTSPQGDALCAWIEEGRSSNQSCTSDLQGPRDALTRSITMQVSADIFAGGS